MNAEFLRYFERIFAGHARKLRNVFARGVVSRVQDGLKMQGLQLKVLDGELIDGAEHPQPYGFSSHPLEGAEAFVAFVGADRSHPVVLVVDDRRYRIVGSAPGEVVIYTDEGDKVHFKRGRKIEVTTLDLVVNAERSVTYNTADFTVNASASVYFNAAAFSVNAATFAVLAGAIAFSSRGGGAVSSKFSGSLDVTDDVTANNKAVSLRSHLHPGVSTGPNNTGGPVGG